MGVIHAYERIEKIEAVATGRTFHRVMNLLYFQSQSGNLPAHLQERRALAEVDPLVAWFIYIVIKVFE